MYPSNSQLLPGAYSTFETFVPSDDTIATLTDEDLKEQCEKAGFNVQDGGLLWDCSKDELLKFAERCDILDIPRKDCYMPNYQKNLTGVGSDSEINSITNDNLLHSCLQAGLQQDQCSKNIIKVLADRCNVLKLRRGPQCTLNNVEKKISSFEKFNLANLKIEGEKKEEGEENKSSILSERSRKILFWGFIIVVILLVLSILIYVGYVYLSKDRPSATNLTTPTMDSIPESIN